jgi:hypothetical protein
VADLGVSGPGEKRTSGPLSREGKGVVVKQSLQLFLGFLLRNFLIHNSALHVGTTVYN